MDSNIRELPTPAHTELRDMLLGSLFIEDAPQAVAAYLADMRRRAGTGFVVTVHSDGCGSITLGGNYFGGLFKPLSEAFAEAEAWLSRDVVGEANQTIGLTRDGSYPSRLTAVDGRCDCGAVSDGRWANKHSSECASVKG